MLTIGILIFSLGIILVSAELFTNGIEWLGKRLCLNEGAVGSILAAVGTALPETLIPIIAILFGGGQEAATEIGIGAIMGAPFMLGTLAMFITGLAAIIFRHRRRVSWMQIDRRLMTRDLAFFLGVYSLAILAGFLNSKDIKTIIALTLVAAYIIYVFKTLQGGECTSEADLNPLFLARNNHFPAMGIILTQVLLALAGIVVGAEFFVESIKELAPRWGISPLILSLIIAPVATELPEKFNSIIWVRKGKDTLALGNITGAMVFQSSIIPAIGITLTPWQFAWPGAPLVSAIIALFSAGVVYFTLRKRGRLTPQNLLMGGFFYVLFLILILNGVIV
ncbi:MAG: sodium:calcium antiporter [Clostridia bacterium]|nr:sodium:calcium antiporter [Clostridia bacterium]